MEPMLNGSEKVPAQITDYKEYHTDKTVKVRVCLFREFWNFWAKHKLEKKLFEDCFITKTSEMGENCL